MYTCLTQGHGGRGGTVRQNVTNVPARRRDGLLVVAGGQLAERGPRGGCRERQGGVNCRANAAAFTQPRVLLPSRGPRPPPRTLRPCAPWRRLVVRGAHPPSLPARPPALRRACACGCVVLACAWACCRGAVQRRVCTGRVLFFAWFLLTSRAAASSSRVKRAARGAAGGWVHRRTAV